MKERGPKERVKRTQSNQVESVKDTKSRYGRSQTYAQPDRLDSFNFKQNIKRQDTESKSSLTSIVSEDLSSAEASSSMGKISIKNIKNKDLATEVFLN